MVYKLYELSEEEIKIVEQSWLYNNTLSIFIHEYQKTIKKRE
jgi:hypothetical protein